MIRVAMLFATVLALLVPATASAARPAVTTGGASSITPTTATLNGRVDANTQATTYFFQYGTTKLYGAQTAETPAGAAANPVALSLPVGALAPDTRYHYRVVARNADGQTIGRDRTFKTKVQPLGVTLGANPTSVAPGGATTLGGQLTGTNGAGRQVVLQQAAFPYTGGFVNFGNPVITLADGTFSFAVPTVPVTTQFRVLMPNRPEIISPIVVVGAAVQLRTYDRTVDRGRRSKTVRFSGYVTPATDGALVNIQKLRNGAWVTVAHTRSRHKSAERSRFKTRVRIYRSGQFRVLAEPSRGEFVAGAGRTVNVRVG